MTDWLLNIIITLFYFFQWSSILLYMLIVYLKDEDNELPTKQDKA